jgi:hypothetical protein
VTGPSNANPSQPSGGARLCLRFYVVAVQIAQLASFWKKSRMMDRIRIISQPGIARAAKPVLIAERCLFRRAISQWKAMWTSSFDLYTSNKPTERPLRGSRSPLTCPKLCFAHCR